MAHTKGQLLNTPAHILLGAALFGKAGQGRVVLAAVLGSLAPDASLYFLAGTALFILQIPPQVVFDALYFSPAWQTVFAVDNSFLLWGAGFALALRFKRPAWIAFSAAGILHLALDFPLHAGDGRPHLWPLSDWVFHAPISYWDSQYHAGWVAPISSTMCIAAFAMIWRKALHPITTLGFASLLAAELWVMRQWLLFF